MFIKKAAQQKRKFSGLRRFFSQESVAELLRKNLSQCGGDELCRRSDLPQAENPAEQDSFLLCL